MKFIVIGEPCIDLTHKITGEIIKSYGGIMYSIIGLAVIAKPTDIVVPVINIGEDEYDNIVGILKKYPNISLDGINKKSHQTRVVHLYYSYYNSGRTAKFDCKTTESHIMDYDTIARSLDGTDSILINMISGSDIKLDTLIKLRQNFKGFMHIDIHNLVMKTNEDGTREQTTLDNWRLWCTNTNTVQMNEFEVKSLSRVIKTEYEIVEDILITQKSNVEGVVITKGINGVSGYMKKEKKFGNESFFDLDKQDIMAIENPKFKDSTGCGDVFAASFTYEYSKNKDFLKSLYFANRISSFKTSLEGIDELYKLK
jgi:hypothetical protein